MSAVPSPRTIVLGNPPSPHHQPDPLLLVQWMEYLETTAGLGGTAYFEATLSDLQAVSSPDEGAVGFVLDDGTDSGVYRYDGSSWSRTADLPKGFAAERFDLASRVPLYRPGDDPGSFSDTRTGDPGAGGAAPGSVVTVSGAGATRQITGAGTIVLRDRIHIADAGEITVTWRFARAVDPTDPAGDAVRTGVTWLNHDKELVSHAETADVTLEVADGEQTRQVTLTAGDAPAGAVYVVPWLRTYGSDGVTEVRAIAPSLPQSALPNIPADILPPEVGASEPVARTIYVKENGSDSRTGSSLDEAVKNVERAAELASDIDGVSEVVIAAGNYVVPPDTEVQPRALIRGTSERAVTLSLPDGQEESIMFRMQDGSMLESFTAGNIRHDAYTFDPVNGVYIPPTTGFVCALKDGADIKRLPYMKNVPCRPALADDFAAMTAPLDRLGGNPDMPRGAGGMLIDGSAFGPYSQQRLMCAFAATQVAPNGIGMLVKGNAALQAVSVYTNFNRLAVWCVDGAEATFKNGDAAFGDYTFAATGFRAYIQIPDDAFAAPGENDTAAAAIDNNESAILADAETRWAQRSWWGSLSSDQRDLTRRDAGLLVRAIANDLRSGQTKGAQQFTKGLFDGEAQYVFPSSLLNAFLESFEDIEDAIVSVTSINAGPVGQLMTVVTTVLNDPASYRSNTGSFIYAEPQGMSYAGQGVNLRALPPELGGVGVPIFPDETIVEANGGRVEIKWSANTGESRLARGLYVDENGRVYGEEFERFVQAITLPQVLAFGG